MSAVTAFLQLSRSGYCVLFLAVSVMHKKHTHKNPRSTPWTFRSLRCTPFRSTFCSTSGRHLAQHRLCELQDRVAVLIKLLTCHPGSKILRTDLPQLPSTVRMFHSNWTMNMSWSSLKSVSVRLCGTHQANRYCLSLMPSHAQAGFSITKQSACREYQRSHSLSSTVTSHLHQTTADRQRHSWSTPANKLDIAVQVIVQRAQ
jgi:hypothetical protein